MSYFLILLMIVLLSIMVAFFSDECSLKTGE